MKGRKKASLEPKKFASLQRKFSQINFSLNQKERFEQKSLSFLSTLRFCSTIKPL